ncbi:transmembrane protein 88B-like [Lepisosteus oculatus]|uniref:transmembrane protein 88B-like n=1 Tax=Lepisosteus oculatus TaxID=7918 RepID=UPI00371949E9
MCDGREWEDGEGEVEGVEDRVRMLPAPPDYSVEGPGLPLARRSPGACVAWGAGLTLFNSLLCVASLALLLAVFAMVLLPTIIVVYFGFQCHSRVLHSKASYCRHLLDDNSSSALIILGFVVMSPLIVVAMAIYCGLARRLRLFLLFQPCSRAQYHGGGWRGCEGQGGCCCCWGGERLSSVKAWV